MVNQPAPLPHPLAALGPQDPTAMMGQGVAPATPVQSPSPGAAFNSGFTGGQYGRQAALQPTPTPPLGTDPTGAQMASGYANQMPAPPTYGQILAQGLMK